MSGVFDPDRIAKQQPESTPHRRLAGYSYSPLEQSQKDLALKQAARDFPDVPVLYREWVYDYVVKEIGEEEFGRRVESGYYDAPPQK